MSSYLTRREFLGAIGSTVLAVSLRSEVFAVAKRPNLVFVFPDQMRGQALAFLNEDPVITPNLDAFAKDSLVLPQAVSSYPVCSPYLAIKYIANVGGKYRRPDKPFALVVSMNPPHTPYSMVPKKYVDMYGDKTAEDLCSRDNIGAADTKWGAYYRKNVKNYFAMVTGVDDQFGRILEALKQNGLDKDTIVVFTSDHGNCLGCNSRMTKNVHYEKSMRVPFMIRFPGRIAPQTNDLLLSAPDIYPTLLDLMGLKSDIPQDVQGISCAPLFLTGKGARPDCRLYMWVPPGKPNLGRRGVRTHRYTFVITKAEQKQPLRLLHDNIKDPYQLKNVAAQQPKIAAQLEKKLEKLLRAHKDPWLNS